MRLNFTLIFAASLCPALLPGVAKTWKRHTIDYSNRQTGKLGADGVRLADVNRDGLMDVVTGWEQGGAIVVYRNPGRIDVRGVWPSVTVGLVTNPEDAVFVDLNSDGNLDVVSSCEGSTRTMYVHWAPSSLDDYWKPELWLTDAIPATKGKQMWMFAIPAQIDGEGGVDLFVSSKGEGASIGWLRRKVSDKTDRDVSDMELIKIRSAGWIMSLETLDIDRDGDVDLLFSDRKGNNRGVGWLENPGRERTAEPKAWKEHMLGGQDHEVMFLDVGNLEGERKNDIVCATRNQEILVFSRSSIGWDTGTLPNPFGVTHGKAVVIGDVDADGHPDLVHTSNTGRNRNFPGISWLKNSNGNWTEYDIGGSVGVKFDLIKMIDIDSDGDLDALTCEEIDNLGVFWFENPLYDSDKVNRPTSD